MASGVQQGATHATLDYDKVPAFAHWAGGDTLPVINESMSLAPHCKVFVGSNVGLTHVVIAGSWEEAWENYMAETGVPYDDPDGEIERAYFDGETDACEWVDGRGLCDTMYVMIHEIPLDAVTWLYKTVA